MGILNLTPDSFYDGGKHLSLENCLLQVEKMIQEGADIIDIGAMSSRPYTKELPVQEELDRLRQFLPEITRHFPDTIFSIDTYRSLTAEYALDHGISIVNDITAGLKDEQILHTVAKYQAPYIVMHMQKMPENMQLNPQYENIVVDLLYFFSERITMLRKLGLSDIIIDLGFGFGKTLANNYTLLKNLAIFQELDCPILVGISRKSMICKCLNVSPENALNGTTALHFEALRQGAQLLRVHDVKQAKEVVKLFSEYQKA